MPITSHVEEADQLTVFIAEGALSVDDIMAEVTAFYNGKPTRNVLWLLNEALLWKMNSKDVEKISNYAPRYNSSRGEGAKTALVADDSFLIALSSAFKTFGNVPALKGAATEGALKSSCRSIWFCGSGAFLRPPSRIPPVPTSCAP